MIYLPHAAPDDAWYRKLGIYLFNWLFWIVPAAADTFSGDVGEDYGREVAFFTALAITIVVLTVTTLAVMDEKLGISNVMVLISGSVAYLIVGILYHLSMRKWRT